MAWKDVIKDFIWKAPPGVKSRMHFTGYVRWLYKIYLSKHVNNFLIFFYFFIHILASIYYYYYFEDLYFISTKFKFWPSKLFLLFFDCLFAFLFLLVKLPFLKIFVFENLNKIIKRRKLRNFFFLFEEMIESLIFFFLKKNYLYFFFGFLVYIFWTPRLYFIFKYIFLIQYYSNFWVFEYFYFSQKINNILIYAQLNKFGCVFSNRFFCIFFVFFFSNFFKTIDFFNSFFTLFLLNFLLLTLKLLFGNGLFDLFFFLVETYNILKINMWQIIYILTVTIDNNFYNIHSDIPYFLKVIFYYSEYYLIWFLFLISNYI